MPPPTTSFQVVGKAILPVIEMEDAISFYRRLGFDVEPYDDGYSFVNNAGAEILHLRFVEDLDPERNAASVYFHVRDADAVHREWTGKGIAIDNIADRPWGMREFTVTDPAGNLIRVGQNS